MKLSVCITASSVLLLTGLTPAFAAKPIDLSHQPFSTIQPLISTPLLRANATATITAQPALKETSRDTDFNQTAHVRVQQTYSDYPVWGGEAVVHIPHGSKTSLQALAVTQNNNTTMNGTIYQDLNTDLANAPSMIFTPDQANKALQQAIQLFQNKTGEKQDATETKTNLMIYVDKNNKAHWAFLTTFLVEPANAKPSKPTYILDAITFEVYKTWDNIQTLDNALGGGFGGNDHMGKLIYDGLLDHLPTLDIQRDAAKKICYFKNNDVTVEDMRKANAVVQYKCDALDKEHNNVYWHDDRMVNGGYSPSNDALYVGKIIKGLYQDWYNVPVLTQNGKPMMLVMRVHDTSPKMIDNAYWDGKQMTFGDGKDYFYPLVSVGIGAHEVSHGFTAQHSNLTYADQSGGLNESFSDMAAEAAEFYAYGHNNWQIGPEVVKSTGKALRYMDQPSKDCDGNNKPGDTCSIDNASQYKPDDPQDPGSRVHYNSGLFNHIFYLLATSENWNVRKAFDVMVQANMHYWTANTTFTDAACGVVKATRDYKYDVGAVNKAMAEVEIDVGKC